MGAMPSASALSVLLRCADIAARTCCVSRQTAGRPSFLSSGCSARATVIPPRGLRGAAAAKTASKPQTAHPDLSPPSPRDAPRHDRRRRTPLSRPSLRPVRKRIPSFAPCVASQAQILPPSRRRSPVNPRSTHSSARRSPRLRAALLGRVTARLLRIGSVSPSSNDQRHGIGQMHMQF